jgi:hypothetical protein
MHVGRTTCLAALVIALLISGCAHGTRERIMQKASEEASSFKEINGEDKQLPEGYSELLIKASIKIPQKEFYLFSTRPPRHENSQYPFVLNVNGQGVLLMVNCTLDKQRTYINNKRNPEGGEGLMCRLEKRIRLKSGSYKVYFGVPEEEFEIEVPIFLTDRFSSVLEFKPIYWQGGDRRRTFWNGISNFDIFLNGKPYATSSIHKGGRRELIE